MTITQFEIDDLRAKLTKATPGPWSRKNEYGTNYIQAEQPK